ncbi:MAG: response regulator transcription factor [Cyclobacteriaceae bacterium]|nr:response regulator transcription factor [Cyclobacteriaceae bacterium]
MTPTNIILVDDHRIVRDGIKVMLLGLPRFNVVGEAGNGTAFFELLKKQSADVVVLDLKMPGENGAVIAERLKRESPATKILILTAEMDESLIRHCFRAGVEGLISKESGKETYLEALESIADGKTYYGGQFSALLYARQEETTTPKLSTREIEVLKGFANGNSYKQIAADLNISTRTVETHKKNIQDKLGVTTTAELVKYALKEGIIL